MSEMYGRATTFNLTNVLFVAFTLGCGFANSMTALIILRFFAGFSGSACLALGGGVIADIITPDQRGKATALWSVGPLMGPVVPDLDTFLTSGYRSYLWRIHIPTRWLAMDLLRPYY
jgi:MFS family permease